MKLSQIGLIVYGVSLIWFWWIIQGAFESNPEQAIIDLQNSWAIWGSITAGWFIYLGFEVHKHFKSKKGIAPKSAANQ